MTTVAAIRQTWLNPFLERADGATVPWTDGELDQRIADALTQLWQDGIGKRATGTVATNQSSDVYSIPAALTGGRVSRVVVEYVSGGLTREVDQVTDWRYYSDTQVRIQPILPTDAALALRFFGFVPYAITASDLPTTLENAVAMKAAGLAYSQLASSLVNTQTQQGLDSGRVIDYQTAAGISAYWERRYQEVIRRDPHRISYAPRRARRGG